MQGLALTALSLLQKNALFHRVLCQSLRSVRNISRSQGHMTYSKSMLKKITMQGFTLTATDARIYENLLPCLMLRGLLFISIQKFRENNSQ